MKCNIRSFVGNPVTQGLDCIRKHRSMFSLFFSSLMRRQCVLYVTQVFQHSPGCKKYLIVIIKFGKIVQLARISDGP